MDQPLRPRKWDFTCRGENSLRARPGIACRRVLQARRLYRLPRCTKPGERGPLAGLPRALGVPAEMDTPTIDKVFLVFGSGNLCGMGKLTHLLEMTYALSSAVGATADIFF